MNSTFIKPILLLGIMTLAVIAYYYTKISQQQPCPSNSYQATIIQINGHELSVDIALTEAQRTCGLSNRNNLPSNYGMLFVFESNQILDFWMKDTFFPLTIAYIDEDQKIMEMHQFQANQTDINQPSKKVGRYALESSPEWFTHNKIKIGDYVKFTLPEK